MEILVLHAAHSFSFLFILINFLLIELLASVSFPHFPLLKSLRLSARFESPKSRCLGISLSPKTCRASLWKLYGMILVFSSIQLDFSHVTRSCIIYLDLIYFLPFLFPR